METTLIVQGMTCGGCEQSVRNAIMQSEEITGAQIDRAKNQVVIVFKPGLADAGKKTAAIKEIIARIEAAGFDCRLA